jgi:hypothetical protein
MLFSLRGLMEAPVKLGHDAECVSTHSDDAECVAAHCDPTTVRLSSSRGLMDARVKPAHDERKV